MEQQFLLNHLMLLQQYEMLHQMHRARTMQQQANGAAVGQETANAMDQAAVAASDPAQDTIFGPHGQYPLMMMMTIIIIIIIIIIIFGVRR